jgi:hypothetical protein
MLKKTAMISDERAMCDNANGRRAAPSAAAGEGEIIRQV